EDGVMMAVAARGVDSGAAATLRVGVGFGGGSGVVSGGSSSWGCCGDGGGVVVDGSRVTAASEGE
nr:hypothetical protein [Tanacetum cinerariifolium]